MEELGERKKIVDRTAVRSFHPREMHKRLVMGLDRLDPERPVMELDKLDPENLTQNFWWF